MRLPFELPYECDSACFCAKGDGQDHRVRVARVAQGTYRARVYNEDRMIVDEFQSHDLAELLLAVHVSYPLAETAGGADAEE